MTSVKRNIPGREKKLRIGIKQKYDHRVVID